MADILTVDFQAGQVVDLEHVPADPLPFDPVRVRRPLARKAFDAMLRKCPPPPPPSDPARAAIQRELERIADGDPGFLARLRQIQRGSDKPVRWPGSSPMMRR